ncbi:MAG: serine/threonine-protein phosphatase [Gemmatimonadota bacterium]|nr:MAG: serine/threonine-protein phosphatase [Gemmatimonadota bacterium]
MNAHNSKHTSTSSSDKKFHKTILNDLRRGDLKRTFREEMRDIYYFYLDKETRGRLATMGRLRRWLTVVLWLLKSMILKLSPVRRVLLVLCIAAIIISRNDQGSALPLLAFIVLLLVLMFELKDKLLARDELETGRAVQSALIPSENPKMAGWEIYLYTRPANEVGGDLVDYLELPSGRLGIALGDVVGKGLGAALLMSKLQATIRALAPSFSSLAELSARMNEIFLRDGLPSHFASLVYLEICSDSAKVRFVNAGHFPPILIRGTSIEEMKQGGSALGIVSDEIYAEQYVALEKNDVFLVYSDGLTEALDEDGAFFGDERLKTFLESEVGASAEELGSRLLEKVEGFIGKARASDDLSLVVLKRVE